MTGKRLIAALQRRGFVIMRSKGSHFFLRHKDGRRTTVPVHGSTDMPIGTLRRILKDVDFQLHDLD